ncbi:rhodopsin [Aphomia sociella]
MSNLFLYLMLGDKKEEDECIWKLGYDDSSRIILHQGLALTGLFSFILNCWVNVGLISSSLWYDLSYRNLTLFTTVAGVRKMVAGLAYMPVFRYLDNWSEVQIFSCLIFAFYETFLAILEVETLNHVCIERFVVARYAANGWPIQRKHYLLYLFSSLFFTTVYTYAPIFGFGGYWYDFSCSSCTFDMILPNTYKKYIILALFFLRSIKPAIMMIMMLVWANLLEKKAPKSDSEKRIKFTKIVAVITAVNLLCWTPIAVIRGHILIQQLLVNNVTPSFLVNVTFLNYAMWLHWLAPALTAIALFIIDPRLRNTMCNLHVSKQTTHGEEIDQRKNQ